MSPAARWAWALRLSRLQRGRHHQRPERHSDARPAAVGPCPSDVWFTFVATATTASLTFTGTAAGMVRVYTSANCSAGPFTSVFCQGSGANNTSLGTVAVTGLTVGTRYYVAVSGYGSSDAPGTFTMRATNVLGQRRRRPRPTPCWCTPTPATPASSPCGCSGLSGAGQATLLNALGQVVLHPGR